MINKKPSSPMKTKKYKCIEVTEDEYENSDQQLWSEENVIQQLSSPTENNERILQAEPLNYQETNIQDKAIQVPESTMPRARPIPASDDYQKSPIKNARPVIHKPKAPQLEIPQQSSSFIQEEPQQYQPEPRQQTIKRPMMLPQHVLQTPPPQLLPPQPPQPQKPPLILSPQHCAMIKHYSSLYRVKDIEGWVRKNCSFAKMFLPRATCEEINILVASCHLQPKY